MRDRRRIERAAAIVLGLIEAGQDQYLPILERLDRELQAARSSTNLVERMRQELRLAA